MAQRIVVELTSDVSDVKADETVTFSVDGVAYEIDLTTDEAAELRAAVEPYSTKARRVGRQAPATRRTRAAGTSDYDAGAVRAWAAAHGVDVSERGRISKDVLEKYRAAGN